MAGLEQIPMMGRLTQFSGADVATNALNAPLERQARDLQGRQFSDAALMRAVQMGGDSPEAWDAEMKRAAEQGVEEAARLIGKWNPLTVDRLQQSLGARTQSAAATGGARPQSPMAAGPMATPGLQGSGPGGNYNFDTLPKDVLSSRYEGLGMFLDIMRSIPGEVSYKDFTSAIDFLKANGHPEAEQMRAAIPSELSFANKITPLVRSIKETRDRLGQRLAPEQMGLPYQGPQPTYSSAMTEAGPVTTTQPVGGGKPTHELSPISGTANQAFLQSTRGGAASKPPSGYFWGPPGEDGQPTLIPVPGGPADKAGKRLLTQAMTSDLSAMGDKYAAVQKSAGTFKEEYASLGVGGRGGETALLAGRNLGIGASQDAIDWWQTYDKYKAEVRNRLFGAALTPNEEANFEKADINANMLAKTIKTNLKTQQDIVEAAMRRRGKSLAVQGYNTEAIEVLTGLPLDEAEIDAGVGNTTEKITATPTGAGVGDGAALSVPKDAAMFRQGAVYQVRTPAEYKMLPAGTRYIDPNGRRGTKR